MQWYYVRNGRQNGPVEEAALFALAGEGKISPEDLVWNSTMGNQWAKASTIPNLFPGQAGAGGSVAGGVPPVTANRPPDSPCLSQTHNRDLMAAARQSLEGNWGLAVGVVAVNLLIGIVAGVIPLIGWMINLAIGGPLMLGLMTVFLGISRSEPAELSQLFDGFKRFGTAFVTYLLMSIFTMLWFLLFVIPGIIASLSYAMTFFILRDNPDIAAMEAIDLSKQMMRGNKWKYFCLQWRFLGWAVLCLPTLGIGFLWLWPYVLTSNAKFYEDLRAG